MNSMEGVLAFDSIKNFKYGFRNSWQIKNRRKITQDQQDFRKSIANIIPNGETSQICPLNIKNIPGKAK